MRTSLPNVRIDQTMPDQKECRPEMTREWNKPESKNRRIVSMLQLFDTIEGPHKNKVQLSWAATF